MSGRWIAAGLIIGAFIGLLYVGALLCNTPLMVAVALFVGVMALVGREV